MWGSERPDTYVDISETVDAKALSLSRHVSQMREPERLQERTRRRAQNIGKRVGLPFAEAFRRIERNTKTLHWAEY
jgi:LmbE family N-acetylglucosaminyl deacetylase